MRSHFLISAPSSNSGKTTLTLGLLRALKNRGMQIQPFKCGPDYIDPIHHTVAAGTQSVNLDTFMSSEKHVREIYHEYGSQADVAVTEGVMGLFDGADKMKGSSAAIAELLNIPVILVVNAKSMAYSAAPLLYGFKNFYKGIKVAGVIFNFVNTESHYRFLQEACADVGIEALGYFQKNENLVIPSRHLGLHISDEINYENIIEKLAEAVSKTIDINRLLEITALKSDRAVNLSKDKETSNSNLKITIAKDEAFSFTYIQNIKVLSGFGEITWFSPLHDKVLPETDFLYLPGGYPELFAGGLSENTSMRDSIKSYCENGGLTYAECGGLMYLGENITDQDGETFEMAGVLDCATSMLSSKMKLGYRIANWEGLEIRGHEFHYSGLIDNGLESERVSITNAKGVKVDTKLYRKNNIFASYMHMYWGENEGFIKKLLTKKSTQAVF
ncbi:cobyrinate a,c-diamide synthase [Dyadobacter psychrotolerans]|uniref:Cobyrinate a,c-diamide synthase n=1 Tax=Dyadobacter psychrotolerans TaxID=2541721 RepID=A0A4R5E140_9BACT|nr:cobyrinate a,c-diamide synthase [Dyadobacter psychrotolerans]